MPIPYSVTYSDRKTRSNIYIERRVRSFSRAKHAPPDTYSFSINNSILVPAEIRSLIGAFARSSEALDI